MLSEIADFIGSGLDFAVSVIWDAVFYWIGYCVLRLVTLGHYPDDQQAEKHTGRISVVGVAVLVGLVIVLVRFHVFGDAT